MKYPLFEILALTVGAISIFMGIATTWSTAPLIAEVVAQGLLLVVLLGAVHYGRRGGVATAIVATLTYACMRVPLITREGLTPDVLLLILGRALTYGTIGVGGGILCGRIQYFLAQFDSTPNIDRETQLFNQRYISATIRSMVGQYERYGNRFSVAIVTLPDLPRRDSGSGKTTSLRTAATHLREGVRLVDEAARLDDGRFLLVLPHTEKAGARIAASRVQNSLIRLLQATDETVHVEILGAEEDLPAIKDLCGYPASAVEHSRAIGEAA